MAKLTSENIDYKTIIEIFAQLYNTENKEKQRLQQRIAELENEILRNQHVSEESQELKTAVKIASMDINIMRLNEKIEHLEHLILNESEGKNKKTSISYKDIEGVLSTKHKIPKTKVDLSAMDIIISDWWFDEDGCLFLKTKNSMIFEVINVRSDEIEF